MRKIILFMLMAAPLAATAQVSYDIKGTWKDGSGKTVFLLQDFSADSIQAIDSVKVKADNTFSLSGKVKHEQRMYVSGGRKDKQEVFVDGTPLTVTIETKVSARKKDNSTFESFKAEGGREQSALNDGNMLSGTLALFQLGKMMILSKAVQKGDSLAVDSAVTQVNGIDSLTVRAVQSYMDSTRNEIASCIFFDRYLFQKCTIEEVKGYYDRLSDRVKQSYLGQRVLRKIEELTAVNIGGIAPDIVQQTPEGKTLKLSSLRGKYVLLDFWASWCGPCLAELPNVKAIYEKYHSKGLEIFGVSLDSKKDAWVNMIAKKGMPWHHVSSLKGWSCPVAKRYNVTGIPRMYILDPEGRIIAQDLRGEKLVEKMKEIFGE